MGISEPRRSPSRGRLTAEPKPGIVDSLHANTIIVSQDEKQSIIKAENPPVAASKQHEMLPEEHIGAALLPLELHDLRLKALDDRLRVHNLHRHHQQTTRSASNEAAGRYLVDFDLVLNGFGARGESQRAQRLLHVHRRLTNS